jgi:hypothetical protein
MDSTSSSSSGSAGIQADLSSSNTLSADALALRSVSQSGISYQWFREDASGGGFLPIPDATDSSYQLSAADQGCSIKYNATWNGGAGGVSSPPLKISGTGWLSRPAVFGPTLNNSGRISIAGQGDSPNYNRIISFPPGTRAVYFCVSLDADEKVTPPSDDSFSLMPGLTDGTASGSRCFVYSVETAAMAEGDNYTRAIEVAEDGKAVLDYQVTIYCGTPSSDFIDKTLYPNGKTGDTADAEQSGETQVLPDVECLMAACAGSSSMRLSWFEDQSDEYNLICISGNGIPRQTLSTGQSEVLLSGLNAGQSYTVTVRTSLGDKTSKGVSLNFTMPSLMDFNDFDLASYLEGLAPNSPAKPYSLALSGSFSEADLFSALASGMRYLNLDLSNASVGTDWSYSGSAGRQYLVTLILPRSLQKLKYDGVSGALEDTANLVYLAAPGLTSLEHRSFANCTSLTNVNLPLCESIGIMAFNKCTKLKNLVFPSLQSLDANAFEGSGLKSITMPLVESIGKNAFDSCSSLTLVSIPAATDIGMQSLSNCQELANVDMSSARSFGSNVFYGTPFSDPQSYSGAGDNPPLSISLGGNAGIGASFFGPALDSKLVNLYKSNGGGAGTYIYDNGFWQKQTKNN